LDSEKDLLTRREKMSLLDNRVIDGEFGMLSLADAIIIRDFPLELCIYSDIKLDIIIFIKLEFYVDTALFQTCQQEFGSYCLGFFIFAGIKKKRPKLVYEFNYLSQKKNYHLENTSGSEGVVSCFRERYKYYKTLIIANIINTFRLI
jgi:hypothetical protein